MKYEAPKVEVVRFDENYFMTFSGNFTCPPYDPTNPGNCGNYTGNNGVSCKDYQQGSLCGGSFSYPGFSCISYNGNSGNIGGTWYENNAPVCGIF